jgi:hypothetical protein
MDPGRHSALVTRGFDPAAVLLTRADKVIE